MHIIIYSNNKKKKTNLLEDAWTVQVDEDNTASFRKWFRNQESQTQMMVRKTENLLSIYTKQQKNKILFIYIYICNITNGKRTNNNVSQHKKHIIIFIQTRIIICVFDTYREVEVYLFS